jgi:U3 small nucleolar RNA-associated protein MPP10
MSLLTTLSQSPDRLLQPSPDIAISALDFAKGLLDPLAADIVDTQKLRREDNRRKRKRGDDTDIGHPLQLRTVYTQGLQIKQVWEQAKRILEAACHEVERTVQPHQLVAVAETNGVGADHATSDDDEDLIDDEDLKQDGISDDDESEEDGEQGLDPADEIIEDGNLASDAEMSEEDIEREDDDGDIISSNNSLRRETFKPDTHGLNDGFFSIDEFNRQSQFLEQMDARGEEENPSDEDEIDWDANPLATTAEHNTKANSAGSDHSDDEDGPTFDDAASDVSDAENDIDEEGYLDEGMPGLGNTNEIRYADFFEPPPKKPSKLKRMRALPKTQPMTKEGEDDIDADMQRAMDDVNRDIFASESEQFDSEVDSDGGPETKNLSTHEKQRAKIAAEIRKLEAANVAKRIWTLSGEARAVDRPVNSLIEEDLEFERVGKPVPVITAEVSEEIEQLIKRRILAREFDEIVRRHPDSLGSASDVRRGRVEVDDSRPQMGLGELYEQEHLRSTDPGYVDQRSAATKKQHAEIDRLWKEVSSQLDSLSNLHFKPKRVEMDIKTVEDKPKISMEDARPAGEGIGNEASMLAPQEVYRAGDKKREGEVVRKSGMSTSKEEMTKEQKLRRRRREKERIKKGKQSANAGKKDNSKGKKGKKEEKQGIIEDLKKGNVKVIDKKGDLQNLGRSAGQAGQASSSALKL